MDENMKHDGPHGPQGDMNMKHHHGHGKMGMWHSWSSWASPVGLGIFFFLTAIAGAIVLYALLSIVSAAISLTRPAQTAMPSMSAQDLQQLQMQGAGTPTAGTGAMQ